MQPVEERTDARVERTRDAVLGAVRRILEREGAPSITPQRVAAETGVSRSTLHRHWPDIRDLLIEALEEPEPFVDVPLLGDLRLDLGVDLHQLRLRLNDPEKSSLFATVMAEACFDREFTKVMVAHAAAHFDRLGRVLEAGRDAGELRADVDPGHAASLLAGPLVFRRFFLAEDVSAEFVDEIVDAFLVSHAPPREGQP